jgi:hypothetical protein
MWICDDDPPIARSMPSFVEWRDSVNGKRGDVRIVCV